jgi:16S rRNA (uracil1498-N3)-methyltransferase
MSFAPRIFLSDNLVIENEIELDEKRFHYVYNVLRCKKDDNIILTNGKDGEFLSRIFFIDKKKCILKVIKKTRDYYKENFLGLIFSPIQKIDLLIKNAVELGVSDFFPVNTDFSNKNFYKENKINRNIIEAIEQSERLDFPILHKLKNLKETLDNISRKDSLIFFCEERSDKNNNLYNLPKSLELFKKNIYAIVGAEGGFSIKEKELIKTYKSVVPISLGNIILRTETAVSNILSVIKYISKKL